MAEVQEYTALLRSGDAFWERLRMLLLAQGIDPSVAALAASSEEGEGLEFGIVVTYEHRVFRFMVDWRGGMETAALSEWVDLTTWYADSPYRSSVEEAMRLLVEE